MKRSRKDTSLPRAATTAERTRLDAPVALCGDDSTTAVSPLPIDHHLLEFDVQHRLRTVPGLDFETLVIRRVPDGVCLEGVLKSGEGDPDLTDLVRQVAGVTRVLDRIVRMPKSETS